MVTRIDFAVMSMVYGGQARALISLLSFSHELPAEDFVNLYTAVMRPYV